MTMIVPDATTDDWEVVDTLWEGVWSLMDGVLPSGLSFTTDKPVTTCGDGVGVGVAVPVGDGVGVAVLVGVGVGVGVGRKSHKLRR